MIKMIHSLLHKQVLLAELNVQTSNQIDSDETCKLFVPAVDIPDALSG